MKNNGKSPTFKFVSGEERRPSEVQSLGAGASLVPHTRQRISLGSESDWKFGLRSCQSWKASSLSLGVVVPTSINKYRMRYVGLGRDSLRSHFVFRPRHCPRVTSCSIPPGRLSRKQRRTDRKDFYHVPQHHKP